MSKLLGRACYGKKSVVSQHAACSACLKQAPLGSYTTTRFVHLLGFPLFPAGRFHVSNACPHCGQRNLLPQQMYQQQRKKDLALMIKGFANDAEDPDVLLHGLQTLMVYGEEAWFHKVVDTYAERFETMPEVQLHIARGCFRFGDYEQAETYCRKAIALGHEEETADLLSRCQSMREKGELNPLQAAPAFRPESMLKPYAFLIITTLLMLLGAGGWIRFALQHHTAWLVSGMPVEYQVEIDGTEYELAPYELRSIRLRSGKHTLQARGLSSCPDPVPFQYSLSLFDQKRGHHALVLNPDHLALLIRENHDERELLYGKVVHTVEQVQHVFTGADESGSRLTWCAPTSPVEMVETLRAEGRTNDALAHARSILDETPDCRDAQALLGFVVEPLSTEEAAAYLEVGLEVLPPQVAWHEFYQDFAQRRLPELKLQNKYALLCEAHPDIPVFYYLLGRVAGERRSAHLLYEKAETGTGSGGRGYYAIGADLLSSGDFPNALAYAVKALEKSPNEPDFKALNRRALLALNRYGQLRDALAAELAADGSNAKLAAELVKYQTLLGDHQQVEETVQRFTGLNDGWANYVSAGRYYAVGNTGDYLDHLAAAGCPEADWQRDLHEGRTEAARSQLAPNAPYTDTLLLYCVAARHRHPAAEELFTLAAKQAAPEIATLLRQNRAPTAEHLLQLPIWPEEKSILCTALGCRFPRQQKTYFRLAEKFNHSLEFPQLLIKRWIREPARNRTVQN